ncbi:MAG: hypothetical protein AAGF23_05550 [Acidobacteriota bacterium]
MTISGSGASVDLATASIVNELLQRIEALEFGVPRTIFLTSQTYTGNLGGLTGADAICQGLADAAGLAGNFKAWLSDSTDSPSSRFSPNGRPIMRVDGALVAEDWSDLTDGTLSSSIQFSETGANIGGANVWTNTGSEGKAFSSTNHCDNWTSDSSAMNVRVGVSFATASNWTAANTVSCDGTFRLYCLN